MTVVMITTITWLNWFKRLSMRKWRKLTDEVELELHKDFIEDMMLRECMKKIRSDNGIV